MAKRSEYQEKNRPILSVLYVVAVIALVVALVLMYMNNRERRSEYRKLVREATKTDVNLDIETRKSSEEDEYEVEAAEVVEPTAQPTEAPALPETPLAMDEPLSAETGDEEADAEPGLPELSLEDNAG